MNTKIRSLKKYVGVARKGILTCHGLESKLYIVRRNSCLL